MTNLVIREWLNGGLIPLNICVLIMITRQLYFSWTRFGRGWTNQEGIKSACAFWWIFLADLIRASLAWWTLNIQRAGGELPYLGSFATLLYSSAAVIAIVATLRLIYALSPNHWGHKGWIGAAIFCAAFLLVLHFINH